MKKYSVAEILLIFQVDKWIPGKPFERTENRDCIILSVGKGYVIYIYPSEASTMQYNSNSEKNGHGMDTYQDHKKCVNRR